jgi:hypothetical protein
MRAYGLNDLRTTLQLLLMEKFQSTVREHMQKSLFIVQTWCREVGLSVNADKTTMTLFTNNRKLVGFEKPILFGTELQLKNQIKYLGVILDEKIKWNLLVFVLRERQGRRHTD